MAVPRKPPSALGGTYGSPRPSGKPASMAGTSSAPRPSGKPRPMTTAAASTPSSRVKHPPAGTSTGATSPYRPLPPTPMPGRTGGAAASKLTGRANAITRGKGKKKGLMGTQPGMMKKRRRRST